MDKAATVTDDELREEVRAWLEDNWASDGSVVQPDYDELPTPAYNAWIAKVIEARWAVPRWPVEWWGRALDNHQGLIIEDEFARVGAPGTGHDRKNILGNVLLNYATEALKARLLMSFLRGETNSCLLYSEPAAGSDLAGVRTSADWNGESFVVNGQKIWTSSAATADYGLLLARTNWDVPKHQGLSFFLCPMKQPGVEVRPIRQITNESHFNEVFLTDAVVPAENLLGELGNGWRMVQAALGWERSLINEATGAGGGYRNAVAEAKIEEKEPFLIAFAREAGVLNDPVVRQDLAKAIGYKKLNALNNARANADSLGGQITPVMSLGKLSIARLVHEEARLRTSIVGAASLLEGPDYPVSDDANFMAVNAYFVSIGGGTNEIQRNIIGERVLGLPKEPEVDRDIPFREVRGG